MSSNAYAYSGGNSIDNDDDAWFDPDVYGNWMDGSNINMNIVTPNIKVNDINSQAQAQAQTQIMGGGAVCPAPAPVCPPKKKYGYKVCKYEIKEEVNPCKPVTVCKPKKYYCEQEDECYKPKFIKRKKYHKHHHHGGHGGYHGGYHGGHGGYHGGYHKGGHGGYHKGGCSTGYCGK